VSVRWRLNKWCGEYCWVKIDVDILRSDLSVPYIGNLKNLREIYIWSVAVCRSETRTVGQGEERFVSAFETWSWRGMLKIKWTDRRTNDKVFRRAKGGRLLLKMFRTRQCHSWIGHKVRHNEFVGNILEGEISGQKAVGRTGLQYLQQAASNTAADSYRAMERMACNSYRWKGANRLKD
jgi:hypothetical protein